MPSEFLENRLSKKGVEFYPDTMSAVLPLSKEKFGFEKVRQVASEKKLNEKMEIHSTIIGFDQGKEIIKNLEKLTPEQKEKKILEIKDILQTAIIKVEPIEEYYLIENNEDIEIENKIIQEHRESIIQITIVESGDLYQKLSNICDLEIKPTFSHVTLFTSSNIESRKLRGIGLYSKNDFNEIKKEKLSF